MQAQDNPIPESLVTSRTTLARLATGLLQGMVLYFLYHAAQDASWPATSHLVFAPALLASLIVPVLLVSSLGHLDRKQAWIWMAAAAVVLAGLAVHDVWRGDTGVTRWFGRGTDHVRYPSPLLVMFSIVGFTIAHALVLAGARDRRRIARYPTYFETAWKLLIQMKFSALFVGVLWLVLWLGAALFMLVKIDFLKDLLQKAWFAIPVTAFAFSCAIHITDVRPAIVRGIRTLLLVLLSWILPIAALMVAAFLLSLPWTGLAPLWATKHATSVLLGAAAVLVILINAAFQDGEMSAGVAMPVRMSARLAAVALLPVVGIAVYSLGLRVGDYGWTTDRIIAAACLVVASCYALGYAWAACRRGEWLAPMATVNVATAFVVLGVLLALFSPAADPARLSVNDQMARLNEGRIAVDKFDFDYLKFEGARYGLAALEELKNRSHGPESARIREKAELALKKENRWSPPAQNAPPATFSDVAANLQVWPAGARLPESFLKEPWAARSQPWGLPLCLTRAKLVCDAYLADFNDDGKPEVILVGREQQTGAAIMTEDSKGQWTVLAQLPYDLPGCEALRERMQAGNLRTVPRRLKDLEVAGQRIEIQDRNPVLSANCRRVQQ